MKSTDAYGFEQIANRQLLRVIFIGLLVSSGALTIALNWEGANRRPFSEFRSQTAVPMEDREPIAPEREGITAFTAHSNEAGAIVALNPNGTVLYHNDTHDGYWDVDPSPRGRATVVYTATDEIDNRSICQPKENFCIRQTIERVNLSTGEVTPLYSRVDPQYRASEWHDVDRIGDSEYIVADMFADEVFVVNTSTDLVTWEWSARTAVPLDSGGRYPTDWTHLNDVEVLDDGRIMVSLRNQDQVVFLERDGGVVSSMTLGADGAHDVLYEQHNPDYVPEERGGPAVLLGDSENNRVVEYQRRGGEWRQSWVWRDARLEWPRDADRLPNGNTLISDSHGGRVLEVDEKGEVVWELSVPSVYEAERLGTGAESAGGYSAATAGLESRTVAIRQEDEVGIAHRFRVAVKSAAPTKLVNGISSATPLWVGFYDLGLIGLFVTTALAWLLVELKWKEVRFRSPVYRP